jgi:uncharacterized membrane protein YhaH (DUF805 family)
MVFAGIKKVCNFRWQDGRARRSEFWYFTLFDILIAVALSVFGLYIQSELIYNFYAFAVLVPSIAVAVRRMHDVDKSGWFILIPIYNIILYFTPGTEGTNRFGTDPKRPKFEEFLNESEPGIPQ